MYTSQESHPFPFQETKVIQVSGSDYEIGAEHVAQVGESVNRGMPKFYFDFWKRAINTHPPGLIQNILFQMGKYLVDPLLVRHLTRRLPHFLSERARGMADAAGKPVEELTTAMILPDLLPILEVFAYRLRPKAFIEVLPPPRFGCSSFVSSAQHFLHGRNLDFPGVAYWDRYQVIQVTRPKRGLKYIGFTTAGAPICGITGINEAQISVSLHQHYCSRASLKGEPPFSIGEKILAEAKSLKDAFKILEHSRVSSSWAFILTDGKTKDAAIYECFPGSFGIRRLKDENNVMAHSNFFQTAACKTAEFATTARMNWDNFARKTRLESLVQENQHQLTPQIAAQLISDQYDPYWDEEKTINRTISQVYNVQSLVLDSSQMKVYLAEGNAPVQAGQYQEYDLGELLAGRAGRTALSFSGYVFKSETKRAAKQEYILSFVAAFDGDFIEAERRLLKALEKDFLPEAAYVAAVIKLKRDDLEGGRELLIKAREFIEAKKIAKARDLFPPEYFEILLFLARANDLTQRREEALALYNRIASHGDLQDHNLRRIAKAKRPYQRGQLAKIMMPYSSYIPFE